MRLDLDALRTPEFHAEAAARWAAYMDSLKDQPTVEMTLTFHRPCDDPNCQICERERLIWDVLARPEVCN